ncbi:MAG: orotidine-5'-phosphate decarboxylase [Acholeplasmataceae bacterium]|nr:orotidine-5'-phosphate decarboxylase [Acholeplasmataceae bacterium]
MVHDDRLIVALDYSDMEEAKALVLELGERVTYYKVGMELYYTAGNEAIRFLKEQGKQVFLDLKLHDIPNTVARSMAVLTALGADMLNLHAGGGTKMMAEAAEAVRSAAMQLGKEPPKLIAVTVLTSTGAEEWQELGCKNTIEKQVVALALLAKEAGLDGVVASPREAGAIRNACGENFLIVTPGVRPSGAELNDQNRVASPAGAFAGGSSHIVVGRPITKAEDKLEAVDAILAEIRGV